MDVHTVNVYPVHFPAGRWTDRRGKSAYVRRGRRTYSEAPRDPERIPADTDTWAACARQVRAWGRVAPDRKPFLVREFGYMERRSATDRWDVFGKKYPTVFHYACWAALVSGHASTPAEWNDAKEFGEMSWRDRPGTFSRDRYPVNNYAVLAAVRKFASAVRLDEFEPMPRDRVTVPDGLRLWCMSARDGRLLGWAFQARRQVTDRQALGAQVSGLRPKARFRVTWVNPWTGDRMADEVAQADAQGRLALAVGRRMDAARVAPRTGANDFEGNPADVCDDGKDVAFYAEPVTPRGAGDP